MRLKMYADPYYAENDESRGGVDAREANARGCHRAQSALEATHRQRGASGEDVDVGETTVSRTVSPSAAFSAASSSVMAPARATGDRRLHSCWYRIERHRSLRRLATASGAGDGANGCGGIFARRRESDGARHGTRARDTSCFQRCGPVEDIDFLRARGAR